MKKTPRACLRSVVLGFVTAAVLAPRAPAADEKAPAEPKPYVLFMGTDLSVQREKRLYRVEDVTGSEFKIHVGGQEVFVPTANRRVSLQVSNTLKLSGAAVTLDQLQSTAAYTPLNNPTRQISEAVASAQSAEVVRSQSYSKMAAAEANLGQAQANLAKQQGTPGAVIAQGAVDAARDLVQQSQQNLYAANAAMYGEMNSVGGNVNRAEKEMAEENYDAVEATFAISSSVPLDEPYMVVLFKFREPGDKGTGSGLLIHAKSIDPVGAKPRFVRVLEGGMPRGFKLLECEVHIYNRGQEIASNVSPKRVELTRDEAQQYVVMEHIGANKNATIPASAMRGMISTEQRQRLTHDQLTRAVYAKVAGDGTLLGVFSDLGCSHPLDDAATVDALHGLLFKPALAAGKPAEGVARLRLADL